MADMDQMAGMGRHIKKRIHMIGVGAGEVEVLAVLEEEVRVPV